MGLVDYSDSGSDSEVEAQPSVAVKPAAPSKSNTKPFQKLVDRSNPGKIVVNLPATSGTDTSQPSNDEPPAKRARTTGGNRFSGFGSFLPPPKTTGKPTAISQSSNGSSRPAFSFKTGAEPAFSREAVVTTDGDGADDGDDGLGDATDGRAGGSGLKLPPPKNHSTNSTGPSIPAEQKAAEDVKLVGKPLMFKPLSVSRNTTKKKKKVGNGVSGGMPTSSAAAMQSTTTSGQPPPVPEPPKKKISLFSFGDDTPTSTTPGPGEASTGTYEPLFTAQPVPDNTVSSSSYDDDDDYAAHNHAASYPTPSTNPSLHSLADNMNLSKAARRELFGRDSNATANSRIVNFDMEREYSHNETLRQSGEQATHNPVRSIAPGKHSLRQLVNAVQSNASALEESFATQKTKQKEAAVRYGWR
ncbi:hypothetical protein DL546_006843 [Coniochaeta pulveracea]|uniref:Mitotic checkpoint regulator, MAD2B-interacting-domain-containing protein n=1 Tax=Coniochaeta pulveracea TaxID=177199 RepID=A0A420YJH0_9PEZI|nr:hypothetical protein DL546_006843 [Coniochaeta pulveracea]